MAKLTTIKPRLKVTDTSRKMAAVVNSDSWRTSSSSTARGYGYRWQKARERYLALNPLCVDCMPICTPATEVDHIVPHRGDQDLFWDVKNWQGLCEACHKIKTGKGE